MCNLNRNLLGTIMFKFFVPLLGQLLHWICCPSLTNDCSFFPWLCFWHVVYYWFSKMETNNKRKQTNLTIQEELISIHKVHPSWTHKQLLMNSIWSSINKWKGTQFLQVLKDFEKLSQITNETSKIVNVVKEAKFPKLEATLLAWFKRVIFSPSSLAFDYAHVWIVRILWSTSWRCEKCKGFSLGRNGSKSSH